MLVKAKEAVVVAVEFKVGDRVVFYSQERGERGGYSTTTVVYATVTKVNPKTLNAVDKKGTTYLSVAKKSTQKIDDLF